MKCPNFPVFWCFTPENGAFQSDKDNFVDVARLSATPRFREKFGVTVIFLLSYYCGQSNGTISDCPDAVRIYGP